MFVTVILLIVFVSCLAMTYTEGLWSNAIRLVNVVIAALLATNFFEPVAGFLEGILPSFKYYWDFPAIWGLFALFVVVLETAAKQASQVKVRFLQIVDQLGGLAFSALIGWVLVCFTLMTLHTAPLARNFLFGSFQPRERMLFGIAPDRQWIAFTRAMSWGPLARGASAEEQTSRANVFDADKQFIYRYEQRRTDVENEKMAAAMGASIPGK
jgi:uncharacterized membrane protein required for colicin V production